MDHPNHMEKFMINIFMQDNFFVRKISFWKFEEYTL